ncbi:hypothetical protein [Pleomorphomonas sp. JP5]|uniref:hypothetical protein n=1 Tax=Pleomorphomonas sp. JP5 TaxID=2942998 RepID=UPI0020438768|nr:hypothetical protein [Pleomorphomonas sp. JP5]MCM5557578.1 hypothetical protein [Pleomorphomonas sp. JP5]
MPKGERPLIAPSAHKPTARLKLDGRSPIPLAFRANAWFRSDGSLIVEGTTSTEEDLTLMIGSRGRIDIHHAGVRLGVRIAATDPDHGIVRFLVQPRDVL